MVTGSHIPDDRNGIKFNKCAGEVLKSDEKGMSSQIVELDDALFGADGNFAKAKAPHEVSPEAGENYAMRYLNFFAHDALKGLRVGVYQHSAVGRDVLVKILSHLGAEVTPLGRSEKFIPVDTEAIRPEDVQLARDWAATGKFDALVSADGDSDRPLVSDENGNWLRGDIAGILCAKFLEADSDQHAGELQHRRGKMRLVPRNPPHAHRLAVRRGLDDASHGWRGETRGRLRGQRRFFAELGHRSRRQKSARPADARRGDCDAGNFAAGESAEEKQFPNWRPVCPRGSPRATG